VNIVIVGGGMGGTILANNLARRLKKECHSKAVKITMLSASDQHFYQPGLLYLAVGKMTAPELYRDQASLLDSAIQFRVDPVVTFSLKEQQLICQSGKVESYDYLVIATGSRMHMDSVPGLAEHGETFYTEESALKLYQRIQQFKSGKIVIAVGVPHKCPMAPLEITFMLHDYFKDRGLSDSVKIHYTYPINRVHGLENVAKWAAPEMEKRGITYETFFNMKEVDGVNKVVRSEEGSEVAYDLLIAIPAHKGMQVLEDNKLGTNGWLPTNKATLQLEGYERVFVCGDTTNIAISKAGSTAHFQADTLADNLVGLIRHGAPVREYDGKVFCFIETGKEATYAMFNYKNPPEPKPPTRAIHWFKLAYNKLYWLSARGLL
jgi:sulfide:quinone oxidoreductase